MRVDDWVAMWGVAKAGEKDVWTVDLWVLMMAW